jgi:hypothetical protein
MRYSWILFLLLFSACQQHTKKVKDTPPGSALQGNWQFLDSYGNYNEAWFGKTTYQTMNRFVDRTVLVNYEVRGDSLISSVETERGSQVIHAALEWLDRDRVVINTSVIRDTLIRMKDPAITLQDTDPFSDSAAFFSAFNRRYDDFLVSKGIVSREEIDAFRKRGEVPEDVLDKANDH